MGWRDQTAVCLATGFFIGRVPLAPGTFGSLLGLPLSAALAWSDLGPALLAAAAVLWAAVWAAGRAEALLGRRDAPAIVIDEIAGMMVALAGLPFTPFNAAAGFLVFRVMDIIKPFPARRIDARMHGGAGIVLDDVVAGIYTNLILRLAAMLV
ncbi:MAG: phosphatidylglycerophosphatase A [Desulfobacteraceae bacterium]|nr:MAG: phosphatidylglycerophosphatase A [Desulfobacteraceae bacterium]